MNLFCKQIQNEEGFVLILALFVLILLTIVGISATNTSVIDLQISQNDKAYKVAFFNADSGVYTTPKLISSTVNESAPITGTNLGSKISYLGSSDGDDFFRQIMGFDPYDSAKDIQYSLGGHNVSVDINRTGQESLVGGGAEFASGAEGTGGGTSVAVYYNMTSEGSGPRNARSNVSANYRKVVGVPGGL